ncbi:M56 family metallopeptidase [Sphingobacterium sp. HJSM2_6]|uniref:M56 family metallopeptidase n=1 Tax=Sphingobacterium sp. HJSM2_6 TaxID=3366264 RepID=UPI003BCA08D2
MENTLFTLINAIGWSILHSIWQAAIIYILLSMLILLYPKQSARSKHRLAFMAMLSIFLGFCININYYYTLNKDSNLAETIGNELQFAHFSHLINQSTYMEQVMPYIVYLYTIGLIIQVIILSNSFVKLKTLKYKGLHQAPNPWMEQFIRAKQQVGIKRKVKFYISDLVSIPLTLGHLKPVVLFPVAYVNLMSIQQVEAILVHELAHIKRNDYLINLIKIIIESLLFFNPFVWKISRIMEIEREHACDDIVVNVAPAITYAHALVECETLRNKVNSPLTLAASNSKHQLLNRIKRITKMEKKYLNVKQQLVAIMVSVCTIVAVLWIIPVRAQAQEIIYEWVEKTHSTPSTSPEKVIKINKIIKAPNPPAPGQTQAAQTMPALAPVMVSQLDSSQLPKHVRKLMDDIQKNTAELQKYYESPAWKNKIKEIEQQSKDIAKQFESTEWKQKVTDMSKSAQEVEKYFQSDDWKNQVKAIEKQSQELHKQFESEEWKSKIKTIESNGEKLEKYFKSEEWINKLKKINKFDQSSESAELQNETVLPQDLNL